MRLNCIGIAMAGLLLTGCAASPSKIKPSYISQMPYKALSCEELAAERERVADALWKACKTQRGARTADTIGVVLLTFPIGSVCGANVAADIRRLKGEMIALEAVAKEKDCNLPEIEDPVKHKR